MTNTQDKLFLDRINRHPDLKERMESLLNIVENAAGDCTKASDAEQAVIEEIRKMGNTALHGWADRAVEHSVQQLRDQEKGLEGNGKKSLVAYHLWRDKRRRADFPQQRPTV